MNENVESKLSSCGITKLDSCSARFSQPLRQTRPHQFHSWDHTSCIHTAFRNYGLSHACYSMYVNLLTLHLFCLGLFKSSVVFKVPNLHKPLVSRRTASYFLLAAFLSINTACSDSAPIDSPSKLTFKHTIIDPQGPQSPWAKTMGDINGDGLKDLIVGGHRSNQLSIPQRVLRKLGMGDRENIKGDLVWYQSPTWEKHLITNKYMIRTDIKVSDIDSDGANDIVALTDSGLIWLKNPKTKENNPPWRAFIIAPEKLHDVEVNDLDGDGDLDLVARDQSLFNHNIGNQVHVFYQETSNEWSKLTIPVDHGEGLKLADIGNDGYTDIIVNGLWLKNPQSSADSLWKAYKYTNTWTWLDTKIDTADINNDGKIDIVLTPAEMEGQRYRISWFEAPTDPVQLWREHIIDPSVEAVHHSVQAQDFNSDGYIDILTSEMNQGEDPDEIKIYINSQHGESWEKRILGISGSHNIQSGDVDNDFDMDFFGTQWQVKNFSGNYPVELWENLASQDAQQRWRRHIIDEHKPWKSISIYPSDINGDGLSDIVTGGWWYKNPGEARGKWVRQAIGKHANNAALVFDADKDGDNDILASGWENLSSRPDIFTRTLNRLGIKKHSYHAKGEQFVWAKNDGKGTFQIYNNIDSAQGDYLQGATLLQQKNNTTLALSWHKAGQGIQLFTIPSHPSEEHWPWSLISNISQDEQLSSGDIDNDGDEDLLLGTLWLEKTPLSWVSHTLFQTDLKPDRNQLADMNGDSKLDAVIGYEAVSKAGLIAWYQQMDKASEKWEQHIVGTAIGPMSLSVVDMDNDNDNDILIGEHNLNDPAEARLLWFENINGQASQWKNHLIYKGDEHHNGAIAIDIDLDGDKDIVSIGWGHDRVLLYENLQID